MRGWAGDMGSATGANILIFLLLFSKIRIFSFLFQFHFDSFPFCLISSSLRNTFLLFPSSIFRYNHYNVIQFDVLKFLTSSHKNFLFHAGEKSGLEMTWTSSVLLESSGKSWRCAEGAGGGGYLS